MNDELSDRMNTWMKMMPGETLEEYNLRVMMRHAHNRCDCLNRKSLPAWPTIW